MEHERSISNDSVQATNAHVIYAIDKPMTSAGALAGGEVLISTDNPDGDDQHPSVAVGADGTIAVTYEKALSGEEVYRLIFFHSEKTSTHKRNKLLILFLARQCNKRFAESFQISRT